MSTDPDNWLTVMHDVATGCRTSADAIDDEASRLEEFNPSMAERLSRHAQRLYEDAKRLRHAAGTKIHDDFKGFVAQEMLSMATVSGLLGLTTEVDEQPPTSKPPLSDNEEHDV